MKEIVPQKKHISPVTVSREIEQALSTARLRKEDVGLEDYKRLKTEIKNILTRAGIWSDEFDKWIDANLIGIRVLGISIGAIGKWMKSKNSSEKTRGLKWCFDRIQGNLNTLDNCPINLEQWLLKGSPKDLQKVGRNMEYMGRVYENIPPSFLKNIDKKEKNK